jgi:hypothetical protein
VARALSSLPLISDALRLGQLSYSKARALTRVATPETEALLLGMAHDATASQLERICRHFRSALRVAIGERPEDEEHLRWVRERETASGLVRFDIQVTVDEAAVVRRALEAATSREWKKDRVSAGTRPASLRRADAFVAMAERFLTANSTDGAPPVEVVVHVEGDAAPFRLACDARYGCAIAAAGSPDAPTGTWTGITWCHGRAAVPRRSRTSAPCAAATMCTCTSTGSGSWASRRAIYGSSARMGGR